MRNMTTSMMTMSITTITMIISNRPLMGRHETNKLNISMLEEGGDNSGKGARLNASQPVGGIIDRAGNSGPDQIRGGSNMFIINISIVRTGPNTVRHVVNVFPTPSTKIVKRTIDASDTVPGPDAPRTLVPWVRGPRIKCGPWASCLQDPGPLGPWVRIQCGP